MISKILIVAAALLAAACSSVADCPTCGTTANGSYAVIGAMQVPQASPYGKPFSVWDLATHDPVNRRLYITDRSHAAIAVYDTAAEQPIGQVKHGFVGSVCCEPDRSSNFNEASGPNSAIPTPPTTPGGKLGNLWVSDGDATMKVFNLDTDTLPTDHLDGTAKQTFPTVQLGRSLTNIDDCARGTNVSNDPFGNPCGDMRSDEASYGEVDATHRYIIVTNGDGPIGPFVSLLDANNPACANNTCVLAQFFLDGGGDTNTNPASCPPPYTTAGPGPTACGPPGTPGNPPNCSASGAVGVLGSNTQCRHVGNSAAEAGTNGLGGSVYNPGTKRFYQSVPQIGPNPEDSEVTEIDPVALTVTNHFRLNKANGAAGCQPASLAVGKNNNLLVGCANREGVAFPASTFILDVSPAGKGKIISSIYNVGRVDQVWYNSGDDRFYLAARDMDNGSVLGIVDAGRSLWLQNVPTGGNAHSIAVDPNNNHAYIPLSPNARCGRYSADGCIGIWAAQ